MAYCSILYTALFFTWIMGKTFEHILRHLNYILNILCAPTILHKFILNSKIIKDGSIYEWNYYCRIAKWVSLCFVRHVLCVRSLQLITCCHALFVSLLKFYIRSQMSVLSYIHNLFRLSWIRFCDVLVDWSSDSGAAVDSSSCGLVRRVCSIGPSPLKPGTRDHLL